MASTPTGPPPGYEEVAAPPAGYEEVPAPAPSLGTPPPTGNVIRPAETGGKAFLENLMSDIQGGTTITPLGRLLRSMGAQGTRSGVSGETGAIVGGPVEGIPRALHGFLLTQQARFGQPSENVRGLNEMFQGAGQVAAPISTNPALLPMAAGFGVAQQAGQKTASAIGAGPETAQLVGNLTGIGALGLAPKVAAMDNPFGLRTRASNSFANVESKIGDQPINHQPVLDTAYKAMEMSAKGFTLPKAVSDFVEWANAVKASQTPFRFADARDFYTALGEKIPWDQFGGKGGKMWNQVQKMRAQLGSALQETADSNDLGTEYKQALKDYRTSGQLVKGAKYVGSALTVGPAGKAIGLSGGDAAAFLMRKAVSAGYQPPTEPVVGSMARSVEAKGMSEENLNAIRQGGEATRRSNAEFVQDVIRRQGLPVDPHMADVEALLKQRAAEFARQGEQVGGFPLKSQTPTTTSSEDIPPSQSYYDKYGNPK